MNDGGNVINIDLNKTQAAGKEAVKKALKDFDDLDIGGGVGGGATSGANTGDDLLDLMDNL